VVWKIPDYASTSSASIRNNYDRST